MVKSALIDDQTHERIVDIQSVLTHKYGHMTIAKLLDYATRNKEKVVENVVAAIKEDICDRVDANE